MRNTLPVAFVMMYVLMSLFIINTASAGLNDGLAAHYPFDNNANDVSGNSPNGIVSGAKATEDRFGNSSSAYNFDSTDGSYDKIVVYKAKFVSTNTISVSFWFKTDNLSQNRVIVECGDFIVSQNQNKIEFTVPTSPSATAQCEFTGSEWHSVIGIYDGVSVRIYLDGSLSNEIPQTGAMASTNTILTFAYHAAQYWMGCIDDFRIYDRALNPGEIAELSAAPVQEYTLTLDVNQVNWGTTSPTPGSYIFEENEESS